MVGTLYDNDFLAWTDEQAEALRRARDSRPNLAVDWDHLIAEIEDLGRGDLSAFESHIRNILTHLLRLEWSPDPEPRRHWRREILSFRQAAGRRLKASPSLRVRADVDGAFDDAREAALLALGDAAFTTEEPPTACPYTLDQLLDRGWLPENRHGLD